MSSERRSRWIITALGVSLLLNIFLIGMMSGHLFGYLDPLRALAARAPTIAARFRALPDDEQARFNAAYEPFTRSVSEARQNLRAARLSAFGALGAPIYDAEVMRHEFEAVRQATEVSQTAAHRALVPAFGALNAQSRGKLAGADRPQGP